MFTEAGQYIVVQTVSNARLHGQRLRAGEHRDRDILPPAAQRLQPERRRRERRVLRARRPFETIDLGRSAQRVGRAHSRPPIPEFGWDGTRDGTPAINGVAYTVQATSTDGREHDRTGTITPSADPHAQHHEHEQDPPAGRLSTAAGAHAQDAQPSQFLAPSC